MTPQDDFKTIQDVVSSTYILCSSLIDAPGSVAPGTKNDLYLVVTLPPAHPSPGLLLKAH